MDDGFTTLPQMLAVTLRSREPLPISPLTLKKGIGCIQIDQRLKPNEPVGGNGCGYDTESESMMKDLGLPQRLNVFAQTKDDMIEEGISRREKRPKLELPPLPCLGAINLFTTATPLAGGFEISKDGAEDNRVLWTSRNTHTRLKACQSYSWPPYFPIDSSTFSNPFGGVPPLTPPQEQEAFKWACSESSSLPPRNHSLSSDQDSSRHGISAQQESSSTGRPSIISLPGFVNMSDQSRSPSTWLERAVNTIGKLYSLLVCLSLLTT